MNLSERCVRVLHVRAGEQHCAQTAQSTVNSSISNFIKTLTYTNFQRKNESPSASQAPYFLRQLNIVPESRGYLCIHISAKENLSCLD